MFEALLLFWVLLIFLSIIFGRLRRARKHENPFEPPEVKTTLTCPNCNFREIRGFKVGDYIFKEEPCTCGSKRIISAIFREMEDSGKISRW